MKETSHAGEDIDVLIVGSGPVGSVYARTIGDAVPDARILMAEVGPDIPGGRGKHTFNMASSDRAAAQLLTQGPDMGIERATALSDIAPGIDPSLEYRQSVLPGLFFADPRSSYPDGEVGMSAASMASGVGGMGVHWGTSTPRPQQSERIPFIPRQDLDAALDHVEQLLQVRKPQHLTGLMEAMKIAFAQEFDGAGYVPVSYMPTASNWKDGKLEFSGTGVILGELEQTVPGFELRCETLVRRILFSEGKASGAELQDRRDGRVYQVRARHVVVCADGLRTPQLLFASGIRPKALGRYLNEHFQMVSFVHLNDAFDPDKYTLEPTSNGSIIVPFSDDRPMQGGITAAACSPYPLDQDRVLETPRLGVLAWYAAKDIQFKDAVEFSETETDYYGMPKMTIRYSRTEKDLQTIAMMKENSERSAALIGTFIEEPALAAGGSSLHYQGTVRMGEHDDGHSVCDAYQRVWGFENLYVGGNGIIPTATASNPTLTAMALAWRTALRLSKELQNG